MQAIPPFAVAVLLPLLSYWIRTGQPHKIEIDKSSRSVTQIFMRFGKTRKVTIDLHRFNIVKIQVRNSRFPKAILMLSESDKSNNDLELACADIDIVNFGIRKINKTLHVFDDIASTLEVNFGFINHCG